jgi:hypothetical protein
MANKKIDRITTPAGVAKYPWLSRPDVRFNPNGVFVVKLIIDQLEAKDLCAKLDDIAQASYDKAVEDAKTPQLKKTIKLKAPYSPEFDSEGNETGNVEFKFKTNATAMVKGKLTTFDPPSAFDSQGKKFPMPNVYGGSVIKVNFEPFPYFNPKDKEAGVSLRLNAVQIIKLVTGSGGTAESCGFGVEEGGFEFADGDSAGPAEDGAGGATSGSGF